MKPAELIDHERDVARDKAIGALAGYKFMMFGYWAAVWVHLNRLAPTKQPSPFRELVHAARRISRAA